MLFTLDWLIAGTMITQVLGRFHQPSKTVGERLRDWNKVALVLIRVKFKVLSPNKLTNIERSTSLTTLEFKMRL